MQFKKETLYKRNTCNLL